MTGVLASVTNEREARIALDAGADIIDLKNPRTGALGALPLDVVREVVDVVAGRKLMSATVGDLPMQPEVLHEAVSSMAATGVDIVKIGLFGHCRHEECVQALASSACDVRIVAVMFADQQPDLSLLPVLAGAGFYGAMLDTADKSAGGLRSHMQDVDLQTFVATSQRHGLMTGLAGSLRRPDIIPLVAMKPDYLGFRGALCTDNMREHGLDWARVSDICKDVAQMQHTVHTALQQDCIVNAC